METTKQNAEAIIEVDIKAKEDLAIEVADSLVKIANMNLSDIVVPENAEMLVRTATFLNGQRKEVEESEKSVKEEFKRMCKSYTDEGKKVTCYDFDNNSKVTLTQTGGSASVSGDILRERLIVAYGEERGKELWEAATEPAPRVLNAQRLATLVSEGEVSQDIVAGATTVKKPSITFNVKNMTKTEIAQHENGELINNFVVE